MEEFKKGSVCPNWGNWNICVVLPMERIFSMSLMQATNSTRDNFGCEIDFGKVFKLAI